MVVEGVASSDAEAATAAAAATAVLVLVVEVGGRGRGGKAFARGSAGALYSILFLVGTHSALFAPAKYGIIPELVGSELISQANGLLVMLTYLAIILGSAAAPWLGERFLPEEVVRQPNVHQMLQRLLTM